MARLYKTDGTNEEVSPADGKTFKLRELQDLVGGYIELVQLGDAVLIVNEDEKIKGLPFNREATFVLQVMRFTEDVIVGPAVLVNTKQMA